MLQSMSPPRGFNRLIVIGAGAKRKQRGQSASAIKPEEGSE